MGDGQSWGGDLRTGSHGAQNQVLISFVINRHYTHEKQQKNWCFTEFRSDMGKEEEVLKASALLPPTEKPEMFENDLCIEQMPCLILQITIIFLAILITSNNQAAGPGKCWKANTCLCASSCSPLELLTNMLHRHFRGISRLPSFSFSPLLKNIPCSSIYSEKESGCSGNDNI